MSELLDELETNPLQGTKLGNNCYKLGSPLNQKIKAKVVEQE